MTRPGTVVTSRDSAPPRTPPTDTGVWFVAGLTDKGPTSPTLIESMSAFRRKFGERVSYSVLSDAVETYFREGGRKVYVSRVVGPAAVKASVSLSDGTAATLKIEAVSPGDWGNALNVEVKAGSAGTFVLEVSHDADGVLETSPELADKAAAIEWATGSDYVRVSDLAGTGDPAVAAATPLTGGDDDRASITDAHRTAALDAFARDLGPGQVSVPGSSSDTVHTALLQHAYDRNRVAVCDTPDASDKATMKAAGVSFRANADLAEHGGLFGPWINVPGTASGTTRAIPYSAVVAGHCARIDAAGNPNVAAAGDQGVSITAVSVRGEFTDLEREELNEAGVNIARPMLGSVRTYGFRTGADRIARPNHWQLSNARLDMAVVARAESIAERFVFRQIDGRGLTIAQYNGELAAMLADFYRVGALFGTTPDDAYRVETGADVNTPDTIADGRLRAVLAIRRSPFAELVEVEVVKAAVNQAI